MTKIFAIIGIMVYLFGMGSENTESELNSDTVGVVENVKPIGNLRMQDEKGNTRVTIEDIESVEIAVDGKEGRKGFCVVLHFTDEGAKEFENVTKELIGQSLAVYVDDEQIINPIIQSIITDGKVLISNFESYEDAAELVNLIQGNQENEIGTCEGDTE